MFGQLSKHGFMSLEDVCLMVCGQVIRLQFYQDLEDWGKSLVKVWGRSESFRPSSSLRAELAHLAYLSSNSKLESACTHQAGETRKQDP